MNDLPSQKRDQERLRETQWDPRTRHKVIQDTITWADRQATVLRNTPASRCREQARKLAAMRKKAGRSA